MNQGPRLLKYEGHCDHLINIFVLAWAKFTARTKGFALTISKAEPTVHRVDFGTQRTANVVPLYD